MKKKELAIIAGVVVILILLITAVVKLNANDKTQEPPLEHEQVEDDTTEKVEGTELNTLPVEAFEIQDNTATDTWGVVLKHDQLPEDLQNAESYTITIDGTVYDLTLNKYNANVFNGQVSSIEHSEEEVGRGVVRKN